MSSATIATIPPSDERTRVEKERRKTENTNRAATEINTDEHGGTKQRWRRSFGRPPHRHISSSPTALNFVFTFRSNVFRSGRSLIHLHFVLVFLSCLSLGFFLLSVLFIWSPTIGAHFSRGLCCVITISAESFFGWFTGAFHSFVDVLLSQLDNHVLAFGSGRMAELVWIGQAVFSLDHCRLWRSWEVVVISSFCGLLSFGGELLSLFSHLLSH
nr:uncharacterized protein LOC118044115 [Populus alba]